MPFPTAAGYLHRWIVLERCGYLPREPSRGIAAMDGVRLSCTHDRGPATQSMETTDFNILSDSTPAIHPCQRWYAGWPLGQSAPSPREASAVIAAQQSPITCLPTGQRRKERVAHLVPTSSRTKFIAKLTRDYNLSKQTLKWIKPSIGSSISTITSPGTLMPC